MTPLQETRERLKWWIKEHGSKEPDLVKDISQVLWALDKALYPEYDVVSIPVMETSSTRSMPVGRLGATKDFANALAKLLVQNEKIVFGGVVAFKEGVPKLLAIHLAGVQPVSTKDQIEEREKLPSENGPLCPYCNTIWTEWDDPLMYMEGYNASAWCSACNKEFKTEVSISYRWTAIKLP